MAKIDHYILQSLRADHADPAWSTRGMFPTGDFVLKAVEADDMLVSPRDVEAGIEPPSEQEDSVIPLLLRVDRADWKGTDIPGLRINSQLGTVISAYGSPESIEYLERDEDV